MALGVVFVLLAAAAAERFFATRLGFFVLGAATLYITAALLVRGLARNSGADFITAFTFAVLTGVFLLRAFVTAKRK